jgi:hyperosmotically inducible protein
MKTNFSKWVGSLSIAVLLTACASSPNERSAGEVFDDTALLAKAKAALVKDPDIKGTSIDVDVNRGVVTLTGVVRSEAERKKVVDTVYGIKGVQKVQTDLKIQAPNP